MTDSNPEASARWQDAVAAAELFAVDPVGTGGVCISASPGPVRDAWLETAKALWPDVAPWRRVPPHVDDDRLLGGLDLASTLAAGRTVCARGILAEADGGVIVVPMAERMSAGAAARIHAVLDARAVVMAREGVGATWPSTFGIVAFDEGVGAEEGLPAAMLDRLAFHVELDAITMRELLVDAVEPDAILAARGCLREVTIDIPMIEALVAAAQALGIASLRAPWLALRAACAAAALAGRSSVVAADAALAARLVLAPRATRVPLEENAADDAAQSPSDAEDAAGPAPAAESQGEDVTSEAESSRSHDGRALDDIVLAAANAAVPARLLGLLGIGVRRSGEASAGRAGAEQRQRRRGHAIGALRGDPRGGARLAVIATLRAAAPWQSLRRQALDVQCPAVRSRRIEVRREDFHVLRRVIRRKTTTIFAVDASGSSALHRLAEAKGAVELLLADCYVRRDQVALLAFRGRGVELLLPPTRSLVRAKRCLAALPGGGGTPLAAGISAAVQLAEAVVRRGETPIIVLLTDGRANIARDGTGGRARAEAEALAAARMAGSTRHLMLVVDTSPQPHPLAHELAVAMGARYFPLPYAGAQAMSAAVRSVSAGSREAATPAPSPAHTFVRRDSAGEPRRS